MINPKPCEPRLPATGIGHNKCILNWTRDCCPKISGDHFVSAAVLRVLDDKKITITTPSSIREHSIHSSALKVNRLCRRHNSALSSIDREAARLFSSFSKINQSLNEGIGGQSMHFFNGLDIERWLLKTMVMVYHAKQTDVNPDHFELPEYTAKLFRFELGRPMGLYVPTKSLNDEIAHFQTAPSASVMLIVKGNVVCGVEVSLGGLPLRLMIAGDKSDFDALQETHTYRPKSLIFFKGTEIYCLGFAFNQGSGHDVWFSHGDPKAEIPTN